jgi:hypothetical protein
LERETGGSRLRGALRGGVQQRHSSSAGHDDGRKEERERTFGETLRGAAPWVIREWIHATRVRRSAASNVTRVLP